MAGSKRFMAHAAFLIEMVEKALNMLGENDEELTIMMHTLGVKHFTYGVKPEYFPFMTKSILKMMQEKLTVKFTEDDKHAWDEVLTAMTADMGKAQREMHMKESIAAASGS
jgi:hemoglobin-like flavoprotein